MIRYTPEPELSSPRNFLRSARKELVQALPASWVLFRSNLRIRYRRSWLGYLWLVIPAAGTAALCTAIRAKAVIAIPQTPVDYPLFVFMGMMLWQIFLEALNLPLQHLSASKSLITRSPLLHESVVLAGIYELALNSAMRCGLILVAVLIWSQTLPATLVLVPFGVAALALAGFAIGTIVTPIGLLYDDVNRAITIVASFGMFLGPIVYPFPPDSVLWWNPVAPLLDTARGWFVGLPGHPGWIALASTSLILALFAWLFYRAARLRIMERLL